MIELKPCPFCGGEVIIEQHSEIKPGDFDLRGADLLHTNLRYAEGKEYLRGWYITCRYCTGPKDNIRKRSEWWRIACVDGPTPEVVAERWNQRFDVGTMLISKGDE